MARKHARPEHRRLLVVTEGAATERQYVERLNQHIRSRGVSVSVRTVGVGKDPRTVVKKCVEERERADRAGKAFDLYVCLVDVDRHATLDEAIGMAERENIHLLVSRLKFEVWLLWHVSGARAANTTGQLDGLMAKHRLLVREKHLSQDFPIHRVDEAVRTAHAADPRLCSGRVGPDPSSAMPILVRMMTGEHDGRP